MNGVSVCVCVCVCVLVGTIQGDGRKFLAHISLKRHFGRSHKNTEISSESKLSLITVCEQVGPASAT